MMKSLLVFKIAILGVLMSVLVFAQFSSAEVLEAEPGKPGSIQSPHIQEVLAELAQAKGQGGACFQAGSIENCSGCCADLKKNCIAMVVPLCHEGDPNRDEFRHCVKGKTKRCEGDYINCAWKCRRAKGGK